MTPDEKWEKVRDYYESVYRDIHGMKIKFSERLAPQVIDMLYDKMAQLKWDMENLEQHRIDKFPNVVKLLRTSDFGDIK